MLDTLSEVQDRRLELIELTHDGLDRDRDPVIGRRVLHEDAYSGPRKHPALGFEDLHSLLCGPKRHAVLLGESAVSGETSAYFEHTSPDVCLDRLNNPLVRGKA